MIGHESASLPRHVASVGDGYRAWRDAARRRPGVRDRPLPAGDAGRRRLRRGARPGAGRRCGRRRAGAAVRQQRRRRLRGAAPPTSPRRRSSCRSWPRSPPGAATDRVLAAGEAIRIMTGAPMPAGADAVVMVEETERVGDERVRINASVPRRRRRCGRPATTSQPGDLLFTAGTDGHARPSSACWPASTPAPCRRIRAATRGGAVDRRRAGRGRRSAAAGTDPREQPPDARRPAARGGLRGRRLRHRRRRRGGARVGAARAPPASATRSSPAAACRWATTTSSRRCSAGSPT